MSDRFDMAAPNALESELLELGAWLDIPTPSSGFAAAVTKAVAARRRRRWLRTPPRFGRPVRRAVLIAIALLLAIVAVAGAIGFGLPGLRIIFGEPGAPSPSPTASRPPSTGAPGSAMGLGASVPLDQLDRVAGFHVLLPADPDLGPPDAAWSLDGRVALAWGPRPGLVPTLEPGVSLLIGEFRGKLDQGYFEKVLGSNTRVTPVTVRGVAGYWIDGDPHFFFYVDPSGRDVEDSHRAVGNTLVWTADGVTYRVESGVGMIETARIAQSFR